MKTLTDTEFELIDTIETACVQLDLGRAVLCQVIEDYFSNTEEDKFLAYYANNISNLLNAADTLLFGVRNTLQEKIPTGEAE